MRRSEQVHTTLATDGRWINSLDGAEVSRHRDREAAVIAGEAIALALAAQHVVHRASGEIEHTTDFRVAA